MTMDWEGAVTPPTPPLGYRDASTIHPSAASGGLSSQAALDMSYSPGSIHHVQNSQGSMVAMPAGLSPAAAAKIAEHVAPILKEDGRKIAGGLASSPTSLEHLPNSLSPGSFSFGGQHPGAAPGGGIPGGKPGRGQGGRRGLPGWDKDVTDVPGRGPLQRTSDGHQVDGELDGQRRSLFEEDNEMKDDLYYAGVEAVDATDAALHASGAKHVAGWTYEQGKDIFEGVKEYVPFLVPGDPRDPEDRENPVWHNFTPA